MDRRIVSQGDLDGACFLYSVANAIGALSGRALVPSQWSAGIASIQKPRAFLRQDEGTAALDEDGTKLTQLVKNFAKAAAQGPFEVTLHFADRRGIGKLIAQDSVVIVGSKEHWFVVTETSDKNAFLACSDEYNQSGKSYKESSSPRFDRPFNKVVALSDLRVFQRMVFRIAKCQ